MSKNRFVVPPKQSTSTMSSSYPHTVDVALRSLLGDDEDDSDICPICDGECTCDNRPRLPMPTISGSIGTVRAAAVSSAPIPKLPSLKIKLTLPPNMLGKRRASASSSKKQPIVAETTTIVEHSTPSSYSTTHTTPIDQAPSTSTHINSAPKRRGRPPKTVVAAREAARAAVESQTPGASCSSAPFPQEYSRPVKRKDHPKSLPKSKASRLPQKIKPKTPVTKKCAPKRKRVAVSESSASSSSDEYPKYRNSYARDDDTDSVQFPTFVSASAISGSSSDESDSDSSSLTGFESDSSIEAEEESFIRVEEQNRAHDKARVRRELLGDDGHKIRDQFNNWVIRPRKMSVGPSDAEMDIDNDATEDDDEDDDDEDAIDEDADETDGLAQSGEYAGMATGWSDDDESSFDADIFFANLSDSEADTSSAAGDEGGDDVDDGDHSDLDTFSFVQAAAAGLIPQLRAELNNLPFEVTQGWDGQIVFTNGIQDGQGILDIDFEVNAAQLVVETSSSPSPPSHGLADSPMITSDAEDDDLEAVSGFDDVDGETTDEELVGADQLPNERAMQLFALPPAVSAIDPMSTMSPVGSPHPNNRRRFGFHADSPNPADILSGRVLWEDSDEMEMDDVLEDTARLARVSSPPRCGGPRQGTFAPACQGRVAIIDDSHRPAPSPHTGLIGRGRGRGLSLSFHCGQTLDNAPRGRSFIRTSSVPASPFSRLQVTSSEEPAPTSPDLPPAQPVNLDDVLDASFLDSDPSDCQSSATSVNDSDAKKHLKTESWDRMSVGTFRRDSVPDWDSPVRPVPAKHEFSGAMKSNPLDTMLWDNKTTSPTEAAKVIGASSASRRSGDRTSTGLLPFGGRLPPKTRKESKHERKIKRKVIGAVHQHHNHHNHQHHHHHHQHHPNMKSRSSSSVQRTNFFTATTSSPM